MAGEEANAGEIARTKTEIGSGARAEIKRENFHRLETEICQKVASSPQFGRTLRFPDGRVEPTIQVELNGRAPQTNSSVHSVRNPTDETARYGNANYKMKISNFISKLPTFTDSASRYSHLKTSHNLPSPSNSPVILND
jgi:hypothetical protein